MKPPLKKIKRLTKFAALCYKKALELQVKAMDAWVAWDDRWSAPAFGAGRLRCVGLSRTRRATATSATAPA